MAFGRGKDVKKSSYYVWFLGAKEATGLRGEEYILPVLHKLLDQERHFEPSKVTLQVSNKGIKIIQNVPKKKSNGKSTSMASLPSSVSNHFNYPPSRHCTINSSASSSSSTNSLGGGGLIGGPSGDHHHNHHRHHLHMSQGGHHSSSTGSSNGGGNSGNGQGYLPPGCKMEQIKHLIPHDSITSVVQEDDIVCCLLLIYNPLTQCPIHVHAYRCDSIETAYSLTEQIQVLIDRPENQKKFAAIEKKLAIKAMASPSPMRPPVGHHPYIAGHHSSSHLPHTGIHASHLVYHASQLQGNSSHHKLTSSPSHRHGRLVQAHHSSSASCSPARRSHFSSSTGAGSDGRSTRTEGSDELPPGDRLSKGHRPSRSLERINRKDAPSSYGKSPSSNPYNQQQQLQQQLHSQRSSSGHGHTSLHPHYIEPDKEQLFESLAHELKVKLGNHKQTGPLLLPPRDYDTISRGRGNLDGIEERESTNKHIVGIIAEKRRQTHCKSSSSFTGKDVNEMDEDAIDEEDTEEDDDEVDDDVADVDDDDVNEFTAIHNLINGKRGSKVTSHHHNSHHHHHQQQRSPVLSTSKSLGSSGIGSDEALQESGHRSSKSTSKFKYPQCSNTGSTESSDSLEDEDKVVTGKSWSNGKSHRESTGPRGSNSSDFISLPPSIAPVASQQQVKSNFLFGNLPQNLEDKKSGPSVSTGKVSVSVSSSSSSSSTGVTKNGGKINDSSTKDQTGGGKVPKFYFPDASFNPSSDHGHHGSKSRMNTSTNINGNKATAITDVSECEFLKKSSELRKIRDSAHSECKLGPPKSSLTVTVTGTSANYNQIYHSSDTRKSFDEKVTPTVTSTGHGSSQLSKIGRGNLNSTGLSGSKQFTSTSCFGTVILDTNLSLMKR